MPNLCKCGCLRPCGEAEYASRHDRWDTTRRCPVDYVVEDRGYKTPCWIWQLGITKWGYAKLKMNGKTVHAHRYYYEQYRGPIPPWTSGNQRIEPDHLCRVRACVNPWHIELVTQLENARRGNVVAVARNLNNKLQVERLQEIADRYTAGETQQQLAQAFGIGQTQISRILRGQRWRGLINPVAMRPPVAVRWTNMSEGR